jgi:hypothetical protein
MWIRIRRIRTVSFWASPIRIRHYLYRSGSGSFHQQAKKRKKILEYCYSLVLLDFLSLKTNANVGTFLKSNELRNFGNHNYFLLATWLPMTKTAGSESGSVSCTDPQHCKQLCSTYISFSFFQRLFPVNPDEVIHNEKESISRLTFCRFVQKSESLKRLRSSLNVVTR